MDTATKQMFKEKNEEIFMKKILFDIENNIDSLNLTISNYINISTTKLLKRIILLLNTYANEYSVEVLNILLGDLKNNVSDHIESLIDKKKIKMKKSAGEGEILDLTDFYKKIDETTEEFKVNLDSSTSKDIYIIFSQKLYLSIRIKTQEEKEKLSQLFVQYDNDIQNNILDSVILRDNNLKNIVKESKEKVVNMNRIVNKKVKKISE